MRKLLPILCLILSLSQLHGQDNSATGTIEPVKIFSERIFIHTDRSTFIAGDTVWFKAYLFNGNYPGSASTDFYIELINEMGTLIDSKKLPVIDGTVYGNFPLADSFTHGFYFLRAYTRRLVEQGNKDGMINTIAVINPDRIPAIYRSEQSPDYRVQFYLESGSFIKGYSNSIVFKATDQFGNGSKVNGFLFTSKADTVITFKDTYEGIGIFSFTPEADEKYFAEVTFKDGSKKKYDLPEASTEGVLLKVAENSKGKVFQVQKTDGLRTRGELTLTGYMFNKIVFREILKFNSNSANGLIPVNDLPEGILQLAITDDSKKMYAKRSVFVYRPDIILPVSLKTDTINFSPKTKNSFRLTFPDSVEANFSVAVVAYDEKAEFFSNNSITSYVFHDAEKETAISAKKFSANNPDKQTRTINDLVLITEKQKPLNEIADTDEIKENYIEIAGDVFKEGTTKPVTEGELIFLIQTKDSASAFVRTAVEKDGTFKLNNLVFDDMARFNYRMAGKRSPLVEIKIKDPGDRFRIRNKLPVVQLPVDKLIINDSLIAKAWAEQKRSFINSAQGKMLGEVVVTTRLKSPLAIVNKKYTTGLFSNMYATMFDFVNDPPKPSSQRILEFLQGKVAGLRIEKRGGTYILTSPGRAISMTGGFIPVQIFLNEMPVEPEMIMTLTVGEIALVKYFKAGTNMMAGFGLGGRLALYTKTPEDINFDDVSNARSFLYRGYTPVQEFTMKDYSETVSSTKDTRTTLYWNPNAGIFAEDKEFKIQFYNSDNAKKFKVVVQGFTYDGRLIDFEKIIDQPVD